MRVLFILKQMGYVRHFDGVVRSLADRGHVVRLAAQDGVTDLPPVLAGHPRISAMACPKKRADEWRDYANLIRRAGDYLRYLEPGFAGARKLRARAFEKMLHSLSDDRERFDPAWADACLALEKGERRRLRALFEQLERTIPSDPTIEQLLAHEAPDILLITPLIDLGSAQTDFVKSAHALGIRVGMVLFSWDNLSTKGAIHDFPDRIFVWNDLQRREALELHGAPGDRIVVTGAPRFDPFFALRPATGRESFCRALGFDASRPIVLYLGSSKFVAEDERPFVTRWMDAVRHGADPVLRGCNILVKPHPDVHAQWEEANETRVAWDQLGSARVTHPFDDPLAAVVRSRFTAAQLLYDCLHHAAAVVGLNTSAELEAAIVGRPVCTIELANEVADGQASTLHFHYLVEGQGGFVRTAATLDDHVRDLTDALGGRFDPDRIRAFVGEFLRPRGLEIEATGVLVEAIEELGEVSKPERPGGRKAHTQGTGPAEVDRRMPSTGGDREQDKLLLDYPRATIWLSVTSDMERKYRVNTCAKEPFTVAWLETYLGEGQVLYDIGANVGAFSLIAAKRHSDNVTVVAFEPGYATFAHLCDNIVLNGCDRSIVPIPLPLSRKTNLAGFKYRTLEPGQSRHTLVDTGLAKAKGKTETRYRQPVLAMRLDDLVRQFGLPLPDHIKLDVDGGELAVLEGAPEVLCHRGLRTIFVEVDQDLTEQIVATLTARQFRLVERHQRKPDAPWYGLFART